METKAKVITICGSLKYQKEIMKQSEKLALEGNCVLSIVYPTHDMTYYTEEQIELLGKMHKQRIDLSDSIFVVNAGGYIGSKTQSEIEYAKEQNKEILYLEEI